MLHLLDELVWYSLTTSLITGCFLRSSSSIFWLAYIILSCSSRYLLSMAAFSRKFFNSYSLSKCFISLSFAFNFDSSTSCCNLRTSSIYLACYSFKCYSNCIRWFSYCSYWSLVSFYISFNLISLSNIESSAFY